MDNLMPPPNGSPEEIQAWNNMMETMVTFIRASTHLMNTITQKIRRPSIGGAAVQPIQRAMGGCETECAICIPEPVCGICPPEQIPSQSAPVATGAGPIAARAITLPTAPKIKAATPEVQAEEDKAKGGETAEGGEAVEGAEATEGQAAEDQAKEGGEAAEGGENAEGGESAKESEAAVAEEAAENVEQVPTEVPNAPVHAAGPVKPPEAAGAPAAATANPPQAAGDTQGQCVCSDIRIQKRQAQKKGSCDCGQASGQGSQEPQGPIEKLCGCGPTAGNQAALVQDMVQKLSNAQQEINQLQQEMARLLRMDTSRRTVGPNPAALYKEIMRDSRLSQRQTPNAGQRTFQNYSTFGPSSPEVPYGQRGALVRQRLFQTNTTAGSSQAVPFTPQANSPINRGGDPAGRISPLVSQRGLPLNRADEINQSFGSPGMNVSIIPGEGRQLPEGFIGCIPCGPPRAPSSLGIPSEVSPIPGPLQGHGLTQRMLTQGQMQQRSMQLSGSQSASRQARSVTPPAQYVGGTSPCRRTASGGSGFRSLPSGYQDSPSGAAGGGGWASLAGSSQNSPTSGAAGGGGWASLAGSSQNSPTSGAAGGGGYASLAGSSQNSPTSGASGGGGWAQNDQFANSSILNAPMCENPTRCSGLADSTSSSRPDNMSRLATMGSSVNQSSYLGSPYTTLGTPDQTEYRNIVRTSPAASRTAGNPARRVVICQQADSTVDSTELTVTGYRSLFRSTGSNPTNSSMSSENASRSQGNVEGDLSQTQYGMMGSPSASSSRGPDQLSTSELSKRINDVSVKLEEKYKEVQALESQKAQLLNKSVSGMGPPSSSGSPVPANFQPVASSTPARQLGYSGNYDMSYSGAESSGWPSTTASSGSPSRRRVQNTQNSSASDCAPGCSTSGQYQSFGGLDYGF